MSLKVGLLDSAVFWLAAFCMGNGEGNPVLRQAVMAWLSDLEALESVSLFPYLNAFASDWVRRMLSTSAFDLCLGNESLSDCSSVMTLRRGSVTVPRPIAVSYALILLNTLEILRF